MRLLQFAASLSLLVRWGQAIDLVIGNDDSVKSAASTIAYGLAKYYTGNNTGDTPGNLPDPYFWWEAGAMFGALVDYWALTGDDSYNNITKQAIMHQATEKGDFMPRNQTRTLGNDDQGFWGMAAMSAAEVNFPNPPEDQPQWLAMAQSLFNQYVSRWDDTSCSGGLRWQIFTFNNGYNYKNSISNGCFFNIASRLARYTGNETYATWATKIWNWQEAIGVITEDHHVHDGVHIDLKDNTCNSLDVIEWSYNSGIYLHGAAVMYNFTNGSSTWKTRVDGILDVATTLFFNDTVMFEQFCEPTGFCNNDQRSFKGYLTRWLAATSQMAPHTFDKIHPLLVSDAAAAAKACTGTAEPPVFKGHPGTVCGFRWTTGGWDGKAGVGEQMNALSAVMYTLVNKVAAPVTADTGGTSKGDVDAKWHEDEAPREITPGDRIAAGFATTAVIFGLVAGCAFVMI